ncbi:MAG: sulfotransferase [Halioglobus sp.]
MQPPSSEKPNVESPPIFITGAPRSGTSWLGEMLATCSGSRYVYEPFNPQWNPSLQGVLGHFRYARKNDYLPAPVEDAARKAFIGKQSSKQRLRSVYRGYWRTQLGTKDRIIVKDPTAVLMSDWVAHKFNAKILTIIRHPCGFASSIESLDWKLNVDHLRVQDELMSDYLAPFEDLLIGARADPWLTIGAYWAAIHSVLFQQIENHKEWISCSYEDLCNDPVGQFSRLAGQLNLSVPDKRWDILRESSTAAGDNGRSGSAATRRDSGRMPEIWRERLSEHQIDAIEGIVRDFGLGEYV